MAREYYLGQLYSDLDHHALDPTCNMGIAVHPEFDYVVASVNKEKYIVAKGLLEEVAGKLDWSDYEILSEFKGRKLTGLYAVTLY